MGRYITYCHIQPRSNSNAPDCRGLGRPFESWSVNAPFLWFFLQKCGSNASPSWRPSQPRQIYIHEHHKRVLLRPE